MKICLRGCHLINFSFTMAVQENCSIKLNATANKLIRKLERPKHKHKQYEIPKEASNAIN